MKNAEIRFLLPKEERDRLKIESIQSGTNLSQHVRDIIIEHKMLKELEDVRAQLSDSSSLSVEQKEKLKIKKNKIKKKLKEKEQA